MVEFYIGWVTLTLVVCALAGIVLWTNTHKIVKFAAVIFMIAAAPFILHLSKMTAGQSMDCDLSIRRSILSFKLDDPVIYLWLNSTKPIYCHTPYTDDLAEKLILAKVRQMQESNAEQELEMIIMQEGQSAVVDLEIPEYEVPEKIN